ncbi:MAG: PIN domain-containing protein [Verrucomicrobia bacterium]|nr:PIN domain-containing protein [Verrucomicrobiota bacterium]
MTAWLLDTGPLVAFFDRSDARHEWAKEQWAQAPVPMLTCDAVLAEAAYLLREHAGLPSEKLLALFERKVITVPFSLGAHAGPVAHLLEKYNDQGMQLADACLVRMSELKRDCRVFTLDKQEFQVYRRFERQVIPLVAPE